jgi:hypothetical protein
MNRSIRGIGLIFKKGIIMSKIIEMYCLFILGVLDLDVIYVDCDGVLLSSELDNWFKNRIEEVGFKNAIKEYEEMYVDDLEVNIKLIKLLINLKKRKNVRVVLWTNRGETERDMTMSNLGEYWNVFDEVMFREGQKKNDKLNGIVVDNEERYLKCGERGILVDWK